MTPGPARSKRMAALPSVEKCQAREGEPGLLGSHVMMTCLTMPVSRESFNIIKQGTYYKNGNVGVCFCQAEGQG